MNKLGKWMVRIMTKKRNLMKITVVGLGMLLIGGAGFFAGFAGAANHYQTIQDREIKINRSDLDGLGDICGTIYVTGHKSPDSDTVGSAIGYARLRVY